MSQVEERLSTGPPRRLLALTGGGVRGVVSLCYLEEMERRLRERTGQKGLVLSDFFHVIGGTSTGSIIAALLALGKEVEEIRTQYHELAREVFKPNPLGTLTAGALVPRYSGRRLEALLRDLLPMRLGSPEFRTGLMITMRRVDTGSPWEVNNIPGTQYYDSAEGDSWRANREFPVADLVLASAAAPTYFKPVQIAVGTTPDGAAEVGTFVDGGVTPHNNPALMLFQLVKLRSELDWEQGPENLQIYSVGTGASTKTFRQKGLQRLPGPFAISCLEALMDDCASLVETQMQWMSDTVNAAYQDSAIGKLDEAQLTKEPLFRFFRYDLRLEEKWFRTELGQEVSGMDWERLQGMDDPDPENLDALEYLASLAIESQVESGHFPESL